MAEKKTANTEKEKTVTVRIPRERKDQEDKVVWVNATRYVIKRGENVEVPESVAEILQHEQDMLQAAYDFEDAVQK